MKLYKVSLFCCAAFYAVLLMFSSQSFPFDVLMTSPEQRDVLDLRRNGLSHSPAYPVKPLRSRQANFLALDGLVKRRNGPNTLWVNGILMQKPTVDGVVINANKIVDSAVVLKFSITRPTLLLKPGQRLGLQDGGVSESFVKPVQASAIVVISPAVAEGDEMILPDSLPDMK